MDPLPLIFASSLIFLALAVLRTVRSTRENGELHDRLRRAEHEQQAMVQRTTYLERAARLAVDGRMTPQMLEEGRLFHELEGADALRLSLRHELVVLDVRSPGEVAAGMIAGSRHIPLEQLEHRWEDLPRDKPLLLYCAHGIRSAAAAQFLALRGFAEVHNLARGFGSWCGAIERSA